MAGAIIKGLVSAGFAPADSIGTFDPDSTKLAELASQTGLTAYQSNQELVTASDLVILAVKPHQVGPVLEELRAAIVAKRPLVVSIAAGIHLDRFAEWLSPEVPVVRAMPNLNVRVGQGMTAMVGNNAASDSQITQVTDLFKAVGQTMVIEERLLPAFTAIAGSSPAWVFLLIDALARGALAAGLPKAQGLEAATQAVLGSAQLLGATGQHPCELIDQVASPGGTTVAGLNTLDERGFSAAVVAAVAATVRREQEVGA